MRRTAVWMVALLLVLGATPLWAQNDQEIGKATTAAEAWLALVDAGNYTESWNTAAAYFKGAVSRDQWKQSLTAVRKPLGDTISRKLSGATYTTSLPGAPDGEYVVLQFEASFQNKKSAVETVTPMKDKDGAWRVFGYYIK